jgi:hypothetical protein
MSSAGREIAVDSPFVETVVRKLRRTAREHGDVAEVHMECGWGGYEHLSELAETVSEAARVVSMAGKKTVDFLNGYANVLELCVYDMQDTEAEVADRVAQIMAGTYVPPAVASASVVQAVPGAPAAPAVGAPTMAQIMDGTADGPLIAPPKGTAEMREWLRAQGQGTGGQGKPEGGGQG